MTLQFLNSIKLTKLNYQIFQIKKVINPLIIKFYFSQKKIKEALKILNLNKVSYLPLFVHKNRTFNLKIMMNNFICKKMKKYFKLKKTLQILMNSFNNWKIKWNDLLLKIIKNKIKINLTLKWIIMTNPIIIFKKIIPLLKKKLRENKLIKIEKRKLRRKMQCVNLQMV